MLYSLIGVSPFVLCRRWKVCGLPDVAGGVVDEEKPF
jgi:hypothetical protein